ncbi:MAG TPA: ABC transporter permease [Caulobacteraceae bacterium]|nr:ABC transporter permease [Caulobacteraceae bacterium]
MSFAAPLANLADFARRRAGIGAPFAETLAEALANLGAHRQRSLLALLGILIGSASIVAMLTIGHMAQRETLKLFAHMGVDILSIHAEPAGDQVARLDRRTIETLSARVPGVLTAAPFAGDRTTAGAGRQSADVGIAAVTPALDQVISLRIDRGRFIAPVDDDSLVAVVGSETVGKLSAPGAPIVPGAQVRLKGYVFTVIGTLAPVPFTALDPTDFNSAMMVPLTAARRILSSPDPDTALIRMRPGADPKATSEAASAALATPTATFQVVTARELIAGMNAEKAIHSSLLTAIGAISLLVGGIGVMNVMLMGVMERRREIGLRAAIGATPGDLQVMFLIEAAALALTGGLIGLVAGLVAALVVALASGWTFSLPLWVLPLGPGMALLVGVAFGLYPAIKASRLDPIEALRAE